MTDYGTFQRRALDDDYLAQLGAEAEAGYDVEDVLRRRGGRPAPCDGPSLVVPVRLSPSQGAALAERIATSGKTRSQIVREALDAYLLAA